MNTLPSSYHQELLLALRLRNVPGPRIAEALAEVDSYVSDTGEDPYESFGDPKGYAENVALALGEKGVLNTRGILGSLTWRDGLTFAGFLAGSGLAFWGLSDAGAGEFGWVSVARLATGVLLLAAIVAWIYRRTRVSADLIIDPRTGGSMAPSFPRWTVIIWALYPAALLLVAYLSGATGR